jgi:hypothetical protein
MLVGLALSTVGSIGTAAMTSANAKAQAEIEQQQLKTEIANEKIKAMSDTNDRLEQFRKEEAANRAALSALGAENISYAEGIVPFNRKVVGRDVRNIEFNRNMEVGRKKYEISVAGWRAKSASRSAWIGAGTEIAGNFGGTFARMGENQATANRPS